MIKAFEREADQFHDADFTVFYISGDELSADKIFAHPNHTIMLWQYYGKLDVKNGIDKFTRNLRESNLKWGIRGAKLTCFAVIEGESCNLFSRMAKRAGSIFNDKEANIIKNRLVKEIQEAEKDSVKTSVAVVNDNEMAIWLNFLLYYISKTASGKKILTKIEPDPFSLSLFALESLLNNPKIEKVDKSLSKVDQIDFQVAMSFPGEQRTYVSKIVDLLRKQLGKDQIFYDHDYQSQLARPNLDSLVQNIYKNNSELIVVFLCKEYSEKEWCGLEWRAIRDIIKAKEDERVMFVRFDDSEIDGIFSIDGYIDANSFSKNDVANFIIERITLLSGEDIAQEEGGLE
ncbi:MAG: TIR domain-containing protein [Spirochaetes bacterium]|nr:TIR domain-containing protein [Spirochaetota bacterium]